MKNIPEAPEDQPLSQSQHRAACLSWNNPLSIFLLLLLLSLITATIILGSVPPVDRDALTHHLFVPKLWLQHGGIYGNPEIPFSYYPMNLDLLYTVPLYFGNDIVPKYIHYLFALLTAGMLYRYLDKRLGNAYGLLGAIFFLSVPIIVKLSITVYVDLGLVFFTTSSLLLLLHWAEKGFQLRYLLLAALCCGLAAGTKYNGLISIFILTLFVPIIYQRNSEKVKQSNFKAILYGLIFATVTFATFSPWIVKNYVLTGNPIYPLHNSLFNKGESSDKSISQSSAETPPSPLQDIIGQGSGTFTSRKILYHETWWQTLLLPVRFFFEGQDDNPQFFDGRLTPFLLILPIFALFFKASSQQQHREKIILFSFALLYFFLTFFQEALRIRYIAPIVPPLVILSMYGFQGLFNHLNQPKKENADHKPVAILGIICVTCSMLLYNAQYVRSQFSLVNPISFIQGKISREEYITSYRPEFPAIQYANSHLPPNSRVMCIFLGNRGYYMDFQPVFEQPYSGGVFSRFLASERPQHTILDELLGRGISHILFRTDLTAEWLQRLSDQDRQRVITLFANTNKPLWSGNGHVVLAVE